MPKGTRLALRLRMTPLLSVLLPVWLAAPPPGVVTRVLPEGPEGGAVLVATGRGLYRNAGQGWDLA